MFMIFYLQKNIKNLKQLIGFGFVTENYREEIDVVIMKSKAKHLTLGLKVSLR